MRRRGGLYWSLARESERVQKSTLELSQERLVPKPDIPEGASKSEKRAILKRWLDDVSDAAGALALESAAQRRQREAELRDIRKPPRCRTRIVV